MKTPEDHQLVEHQLDAVDAVLAGGAVTAEDPHERELQELALALRADSPTADPEFERRLGARVRAGFPRDPRSRRARVGIRLSSLGARLRSVPTALRWRRPPLPLLAGAASLLLAVVVAVSLQDGSEDPRMAGTSAPAAREAAPGSVERSGKSLAAPDSLVAPGPPPPSGDGFSPGRRQRIERSTALTLAAPADELERVGGGVTTVADRHKGFVLRSSITSGKDGGAGGNFELRIPADEVEPALRELSDLATVRSRTQSGEDVTRQFVSASDRLKAARAERRSLLRRLEGAETDAQTEALRRRLDLVSGEIRGLRSELRELRLRTDYVAVSVTLEARDGDSGAGFGATDDALDDALDSLAGAVNLALRTLGVILPLALVAGLALAVARLYRRRRREAVLS